MPITTEKEPFLSLNLNNSQRKMDALIKEDHFITHMPNEYETTCWGCGSHLTLPSYSPAYKCSWCGAITNKNPRQHGSKYLRWRRLRDQCFVSILLLFMLLVICGGVWAVYPVIFSISLRYGVLNSVITMILSLCTLSSFSLAAFSCAGAPPDIAWGSYSVVDSHGLENYTFCQYCSKPKSPRTHHCRTCGMCVLDMDHHCPFIGNCVGAANHRSFVLFLISAVISTIYVFIMSTYAALHLWPSLAYGSLGHLTGSGIDTAFGAVKLFFLALLNSAELLSTRWLVLIYMFVSSFSVAIGLSVLLWQQLCYVYEGKTYLSHLSSQGDTGVTQRDCRNIHIFFGWQQCSVSQVFSGLSGTKKSHSR